MKGLDLSMPHALYLPDEAATMQLGALIAPQLQAGDVVYLSGDLGAGKSSLARGLVRMLTNPLQEVPSPTFTLVQAYDTPHFQLLHLDLYRIEDPYEVHELGLDEARSHSVLVIEWPDRLAHLGFDDRLDIVLEHGDKTNLPSSPGKGRTAHIKTAGNFRKSPRLQEK